MDLVKIKDTQAGEIPFTKNTCRKFHSLKKYPSVIFKVGGDLYFDKDAWRKVVEDARARNVKEASRIHNIGTSEACN